MHPLIYLVLSLVLSLLVSCTGSKMEKSAESYAMKEARWALDAAYVIFPTFLAYNKHYAYRQDVSNYKPAGVYMSTHFFDAAKQLAAAENQGNPNNFFERLPPTVLKAYAIKLE